MQLCSVTGLNDPPDAIRFGPTSTCVLLDCDSITMQRLSASLGVKLKSSTQMPPRPILNSICLPSPLSCIESLGSTLPIVKRSSVASAADLAGATHQVCIGAVEFINAAAIPAPVKVRVIHDVDQRLRDHDSLAAADVEGADDVAGQGGRRAVDRSGGGTRVAELPAQAIRASVDMAAGAAQVSRT